VIVGNQVYVIGGGGHAKVVVRTLLDLGYVIASVFDDDPKRWGFPLLGIPIVGPIDRIRDCPPLPAVIAIGTIAVRMTLAERLNFHWLTVVDRHAHVDPTVRLGQGTVVMRGAVIQADSSLGDHVIVNTAASVDHDCTLGNYVHISPGVHLAGGVTVGEATFMGIGSVAIPGVRIGTATTVGAGAAVVHDLPARVLAVGVPARVIKSYECSPTYEESPGISAFLEKSL